MSRPHLIGPLVAAFVESLAINPDRCDFCRETYASDPGVGCPNPTDHDAHRRDIRPVAGRSHPTPTHDTPTALIGQQRGSL